MAPRFPQSEFQRRLSALQQAMAERGLDACVVHTPENICYLTGHETPGYYTYQCLLVPAEGEPVLLLREAEVANAEQYSYLKNLVGFHDASDPVQATIDAFERFGIGTENVAIEERSMYCTPLTYRRLVEGLRPRRVEPADAFVAELRLIKSEAEIEAIRQAASITNRAMAAAVEAVRPGVRERDVAAAAMAALLREGSEYLGMEPFVASGPRSSVIHASWGDRVIGEGEPVLIEFAASYKRYHAALMYTHPTGPLSPELQPLFDACREALAETLSVVRPGNTPAQCHQACRDAIGRRGLLDYYRKRTGYSIGLAFAPDWGEGHILSLGEGVDRPLQPGMVLHVVPAIRKPGVGGAGFSATVLVTETGHEVLTHFS